MEDYPRQTGTNEVVQTIPIIVIRQVAIGGMMKAVPMQTGSRWYREWRSVIWQCTEPLSHTSELCMPIEVTAHPVAVDGTIMRGDLSRQIQEEAPVVAAKLVDPHIRRYVPA